MKMPRLISRQKTVWIASALLIIVGGRGHAQAPAPKTTTANARPTPVAASGITSASRVPSASGITSASAGAPVRLAVVATTGVQSTGDGTGKSDLGIVNPSRTPTVERTFTLKNTSVLPVTIARLRAACGCTTLLLTRNGTAAPTAVLAPGDQVDVKMAVRVQGQHSGKLQKYAWAYGPVGDTPLAEMEMDLTIREAISFTPPALDFGSVSAGQSPALTLSVTAQTQGLGGATLPPLASSDPDIQVAPDGAPVASGPGSIAQRYRVTLSPAAKGGRVGATLSYPSGGASLADAQVSVFGQVTGELLAAPASLFLGSIPAGQGAHGEVRVSVHAAGGAAGLTASSSSPWVTVHLDPGMAPNTPRRLTVTLKKDAPAGILQAQVTVQTAHQERLAVPVIVEVVRRSP